MGDFNMDLLKSNSCSYSENFLLSCQSYSLLPSIDKPTRIHNNSATLIDNILINTFDDDIHSGNIISDISDHFSQFCVIQSLKDGLTLPSYRKMRDFSRFSENKFMNELRQIRWNIIIEKHHKNVNKLFLSFYNKLNKLVNKHAPRRNVTKRDIKNFSKPWITTGIKKSIKEKNEFLNQAKYAEYKYYRNKISTLIRVSKKKYYFEYFELNIKNMKNTWDGINDLINRNKRKSCRISGLKDTESGRVIRESSVLPNLLNKYFASIGHKLGTSTTQSESRFSHYMKNMQIPQSFFCILITPSEVVFEILSLPNKKTHGLYSCPTKILKCSSNVISKPFSDILNISIENGVYF